MTAYTRRPVIDKIFGQRALDVNTGVITLSVYPVYMTLCKNYFDDNTYEQSIEFNQSGAFELDRFNSEKHPEMYSLCEKFLSGDNSVLDNIFRFFLTRDEIQKEVEKYDRMERLYTERMANV